MVNVQIDNMVKKVNMVNGGLQYGKRADWQYGKESQYGKWGDRNMVNVQIDNMVNAG